jgi:CTP:molybdopterin cytidylyltransferase MocA
MPKALVDTGNGPWVRTSLGALQPCEVRLVVIGASSSVVAATLPDDVISIDNPEYRSGMGSSLRRALTVLLAAVATGPGQDQRIEDDARAIALIGACDAAVVHLVDLPGVGEPVVRRLIGCAGSASHAPDALVRAGYAGVPGHPVLLGRRHWAGVAEHAEGDTGARGYFRLHPPVVVECGDIGSGEDIDVPPGGATP